MVALRSGQVALVLIGLAAILLAIGGGLLMGKSLAEISDATDLPGEIVGFAIFFYVVMAALLCFAGFAFAAAGNLTKGRFARAFRQVLNSQFGVWLSLGALLIFTASVSELPFEIELAESILITVAAVLGIIAASVYTWAPLGLGEDGRGSRTQASGTRNAIGLFLGLAALVVLLIGTVMLPGKAVLDSGFGAMFFGLLDLGLRSFVYQFGGPIQLAGLLAVVSGLAIGLGRGRVFRLGGLSIASAGLVTVGVGQIVHAIGWHVDMVDAAREDVHPWDLVGVEEIPNTIEVGWGLVWAGTELIIIAGLAILVAGGIGLFVHGRGLIEAVGTTSSARPHPSGPGRKGGAATGSPSVQTAHTSEPGRGGGLQAGGKAATDGGQVGVHATAPSGGSCPQCGTQVGAEARFCSGCGHEVRQVQRCPHCGEGTTPGASYCGSCGGQL